MDIPFLDRLLSIADAADWLGCQPDAIRAAIRTGRIPAVRAGQKLVRIHPRSVVETCSVALIRRQLKQEELEQEIAEEQAAVSGSDAPVDWQPVEEQPVADNQQAQ